MQYLEQHDILFYNQYGFRKNYSTFLALQCLSNKITVAIDNKKYTIGIFLDLSKAFDTVNHNILLKKFEHYGIRGLALDWITSYLSGRQQFVEYNGTSSSYNDVICGVPQGSVLAPLLFLIYINDICNASNILELILFADDTNIFFSDDDISQLMNVVNSQMEKISEWFRANMLSLNEKKSNFMIFRPRQKRQTIELLLKINGQKIDNVKETMFLGVILDEYMSWKSHISHIASKISKSIGIIYKSSFYLSKSALRTLYYALIYPYIQYCIIIWGSTYPTCLYRINLLQKRVIRIINREAYDAPTDPIFKDLNILKLNDIYLLQLGIFMYKYQNNLLPINFANSFLRTDQVHNYNTRASRLFYVPSCRTNIRKFTVNYQGLCFYNSIDADIRNVASISLFQSKLKTYLSSN